MYKTRLQKAKFAGTTAQSPIALDDQDCAWTKRSTVELGTPRLPITIAFVHRSTHDEFFHWHHRDLTHLDLQ